MQDAPRRVQKLDVDGAQVSQHAMKSLGAGPEIADRSTDRSRLALGEAAPGPAPQLGQSVAPARIDPLGETRQLRWAVALRLRQPLPSRAGEGDLGKSISCSRLARATGSSVKM